MRHYNTNKTQQYPSFTVVNKPSIKFSPDVLFSKQNLVKADLLLRLCFYLFVDCVSRLVF